MTDQPTPRKPVFIEKIFRVKLLNQQVYYEDDPFMAGFMAVCDRVVGEEFFLAILYHEWFVIYRSAVLES